MTTMKEKMLAGELYIADDPVIAAAQQHAADLMQRLNAQGLADAALRKELLAELLGSFGEGSDIRPPFYVDYGTNIQMGTGCFVNFGGMFFDVAPITIGDDVLFGPNVQLLTPLHPIEPQVRREKWEAARPITIGDNVWIGGGAIVLPGVTIGENAIIGAGSVVTKDIPANAIAVGNPCRMMRIVEDGPVAE